MPARAPRLAAALLSIVALVVGACDTGGSATTPAPATPSGPASTAGTAPSDAAPSAEPTPGDSLGVVDLTVGLGYIPSVQFAPFYLALENGSYEAAGLRVEFQNRIDPDLITLVGQGAIDIGIGDGTSIIPAVSQGIPVRYLATIYGKFPSIIVAKASSGIDEPADLAGKKLGTPGRYGSGWLMTEALLASAGLSAEDIEVVEYPDFGQGAAVAQDAVDAATGFVNNEPVQLQLAGFETSILRVDDIVPLPGPGLIAGTKILEERPDVVEAFVIATLAAMEEISADPQVGLDAAFAVVPELAGDPDTQRAILEATIDTWRGPAQEDEGFGAVDLDAWAASIEFLDEQGLVANPVTVDDVVQQTAGPAPGG